MFNDTAQKLLTPGAVAIIPTDTVYGLVARLEDKVAVQRLYELKAREFRPGTIVAANIEQLVKVGIKRRYLKAVEQFWPGAVSVIIPFGPDFQYLHYGRGSLPVRVTDNQQLAELLEQTGPLLTTSANQTTKPVAETVEAARQYFGDRVDFYVDGGDLTGRPPSTIIRIIDDAIEVLRQGAVIVKENE